MYILELRRGWPLETRVCSATSGLLSSYNGHLGKLYYAWQKNTDASGGEQGRKGPLLVGTVVMEPLQGNWPHLNLILCTPNNFAFLG